MDIPPHWEQIDFEDAFENISLVSRKVPQKDYLPSGTIPIVDQGIDLIGGFTNDESKCIQSTRQLIVFGDHTKCFKLVGFRFAPGADGIKVLRPFLIDERFAYYACRALQLPDRGYSRHYPFLKKSKIPLAPYNEQRRIVAKIEELFSELDKGIESLKTARAKLNVYRQAVLKHAFEGKLTARWREVNKDKLETSELLLSRIKQEREARYEQQLQEWKAAVNKWEEGGRACKKPIKPRRQGNTLPLTPEEIKKLPDLPTPWQWVKLGQLVWSVKDGPHYSPEYTISGIPFISGGNIQPSGIDFFTAKFIAPELHQDLAQRCKPERGDVLYTKGGTTGIARVNTYNMDFNVWVHIAVLKITESLKPFYLQHALNSPDCYAQSQKYTHGVGNQDLGLTRMVKIILPLCCLSEQKEIIQIVDQMTLELDTIEDEIKRSLNEADTLRQSILKRAFSGQLVPQDPRDEPASVLLDRIRAEREKAAKNNRSKKTKKRKATA